MDTWQRIDALMNELRGLAKSVYMVSEKRPPSGERKWSLYVLFDDGFHNEKFWGDDTSAGQELILRRAIAAAKERK